METGVSCNVLIRGCRKEKFCHSVLYFSCQTEKTSKNLNGVWSAGLIQLCAGAQRQLRYYNRDILIILEV